MKTRVILIVFILIAAVSGYYYGDSKGYKNGFETANNINKIKVLTEPIDSIKDRLKQREIKDINSFIHGKAGINKKDEGGLFNIKYVYYFEGTLTNEAVMARAKDVKIKIDFFSKTESIIGSQELTIYDYINPSGLLNFKKKVEVPDNFEKIEFYIINATGE